MRRKEERSKKSQTNNKAKQHSTRTQGSSFFVRKMSCLGWDSNPRHYTLDMYMYIHCTSVSLAVFQVVYVCDMYLYDVHMCIVCVRVCVCATEVMLWDSYWRNSVPLAMQCLLSSGW